MEYDLMDIGCGSGDSTTFMIKYANLVSPNFFTNVCGIDREPHRFNHELEIDYLHFDIVKDYIPVKSKNSSYIHVLEHLKDLEAVGVAIKKALDISEAMFVMGPSFEDDSLLESFGCQYYWSNWTGHKTHLKLNDLKELLKTYEGNLITFKRKPIYSTDDPSILPLGLDKDQHEYNRNLHGVKESVDFKEPLYKEIGCVFLKSNTNRDFWEKFIKAIKGTSITEYNFPD